MLAYVLALVVGLGSVALYMAAFFFPEIHRKNDFIWSGIGLFYALVLWVCAGRITGGLLLGQIASVVLLGGLAWQLLLLRRQLTPADQQTAIPTAEDLQEGLSNLTSPESLSNLPGQVMNQVTRFSGWVQSTVKTASQPKPKAIPTAAEETYVPPSPEAFGSAGRRVQEAVEQVDARIEAAMAAQEEAAAEIQEAYQVAESEVVETVTEVVETVEAVVSQTSDAAGEVAQEVAETVATGGQKTTKALSKASEQAGGLNQLVQQVQGWFKKLTQRQSKPVYVRKQFRSTAEELAEEGKQALQEAIEVTGVAAAIETVSSAAQEQAGIVAEEIEAIVEEVAEAEPESVEELATSEPVESEPVESEVIEETFSPAIAEPVVEEPFLADVSLEAPNQENAASELLELAEEAALETPTQEAATIESEIIQVFEVAVEESWPVESTAAPEDQRVEFEAATWNPDIVSEEEGVDEVDDALDAVEQSFDAIARPVAEALPDEADAGSPSPEPAAGDETEAKTADVGAENWEDFTNWDEPDSKE